MASSNWFSHAEKLTPTEGKNSGQSPTLPQPSMLGITRKYYCPTLWVVKMIYLSPLSLGLKLVDCRHL